MRWPALLLGPLIAVLIVSAAAAAAVTVSAPAIPGSSSGTRLNTDAVPLPASASSQELPAAAPISLTFTLSNPHAVSLSKFLTQVENPSSSLYRQFVTYPEFVQRFAPPSSSVASVEAALEEAGAREITAAPDRSSVTAVLPASSVDKLLGVDLVSYRSADGSTLYTSLGTVSLPPSLAGVVSGVGGLSDSAAVAVAIPETQPAVALRPVSAAPPEFARVNTTGKNWFVGSDYAQAYGATELFPGAHRVPNATYPSSVAIATLLVSGFNATFGNLPPWDPAVIDAYFNGTLGPGWPMPRLTGVPVTVNGVTPPLPGSFGDENDTTAYETENSLDLEMAGSLAPGASLYNFYFAASLLNASPTNGNVADYFAADLAEALAYSYAPAHLAVVSCSFGLPDLDDPAWDSELLTAAATGVTIVAASGDQGDAPDSMTGRSDGQWPIWPATAASDLAGSLSVGGVSLNLSGTPSMYYNGTPLNLSYDPNAGVISNVSAWYDTLAGPGAYAGTEGGASTVYPEPSWQFRSAAQPAIVNATILQGATTLGRTGPDVAMPANLTLATVFANSTGAIFFEILEGTSIGAPVLAGLLADVVAVENNRTAGPWTSLGFIDPEIYRFASFFATHPGAASDPFSDVTVGCNYLFCAAPGWDPATGWGGVNAPGFLAADQNLTLLRYNYTGPTPLLPPAPSGGSGVPWTYIFAIFGVGLFVAIALVALAARPSRSPNPPPGVPWGAQGEWSTASSPTSPAGTYPGATFLCPHCGAIRPSEPVRCPQCGIL